MQHIVRVFSGFQTHSDRFWTETVWGEFGGRWTGAS